MRTCPDCGLEHSKPKQARCGKCRYKRRSPQERASRLKAKRAWVDRNRERVQTKRRAEYEANRERELARTAAYKVANPQRVAQWNYNRYIRYRAAYLALKTLIGEEIYDIR